MKRKHAFRSLLLLAVLAIAPAGCKKKQPEGQPAAKTSEGSATPAGSAVAGSAVAGSAAPDPVKPPVEAKTIVETAKAAGNFTTLLKAIDAAGLTSTLGGAGPFTVFAPTDEAFAKVPAKDLEALLADKTKLEALLQYHVVSGTIASKDLAAQKTLKTVQGTELAIDGTKVGNATVVAPDVAASNGVIHAIDTVLALPK